MKKITFFTLVAVLFCAVFAAGQANTITQTTLSTAITTTNGTVVTVTSATGATAGKTDLYVDGELMKILAVSGTTLTVFRGSGGTAAATHNNSSLAFIGAPGFFQSFSEDGSCTKANLVYHPHIDVKNGAFFSCVGGQWVGNPNSPYLTGINGASGRYRWPTVTVGSVAYGSLGTAKTTVAGTVYCADVFIGRSFVATGIGVLNAGTVATDKGIVILYDSGGALVANSAVAGAATVGANAFQQYAFTGTVLLNGPAQYFACYQSNGATDNIRTVAASTFIDVLTTSSTGVFATIPATITVPTTFTADVGPIAYVY